MTQTILAEKTPINNTYQCLILIFFLNYHCPPSYCSCLFGVLCEVAKATTSQNDDEWQHHEHEVQVMKGDKWQLLILFHPAPWICMKISAVHQYTYWDLLNLRYDLELTICNKQLNILSSHCKVKQGADNRINPIDLDSAESFQHHLCSCFH
jgi:hypothetical protein